ncbi:hypothetical protein PACTADRAFT_48094 [Pachysolen tannophilus NRRL Y-2460]|uniref:Respiratory growth induced protein 1 n=1 Tax=Pachysolen tannophilus NRRL Y-2460 TaxID=669874 RepID=A0A1E4U2T2_PACTA|nr:hypothetical protein PACTADRAFT_48094 [Pachysolen tannophilus NRRL Y-2460]
MTKKDKEHKSGYTTAPTEPTKLVEIKDRPKHKSDDPPLRKFDNLEAFESYLKDETWDNEFDYIHAQLVYYPPFVLHECHDDPENNFKPSMTNLNKKFLRNLHHHVDRHLLVEIKRYSGVEYDFGKSVEEHTADGKVKWHFKDESNHGIPEESLHDRKWKLELTVESHSNDSLIVVDLQTVPL